MKTTPTTLKFAFLALVLTATAYAAFQCSFCKGTGWDKYGRTGEALDRNLLMVVSIPILLAMIVWPSITTKPWVAWCSFAVLIIYGIARNLPLLFSY
jgi:hypothetical protein